MSLGDHYPLALRCTVLGLARSSCYQQPHPPDDTTLREQIETIVGAWPTYGYRRVTAQLARDYQPVNHKRVRRVMRAMGLVPPHKAKTRRTTNSDHPFPRYPNLVAQLIVSGPDQVWVADITYIRLAHEFVYLAVLMDVFTRCIRGWHLARSLDQDLALTALRRALPDHQPQIHHSDQGVQYAAAEYVAMLQTHHVEISMAEVGEPTQNGHAERLVRTIKDEEVNLSEYADYADAYTQIGCFLDDVYMHKRIHSALGYLTPAEFESQWRTQQAAA